jgi:hypothetical protein
MEWYMLIIPAFGRLRQMDSEFKTSLGYIARSRQHWATNKKQSKTKQTLSLRSMKIIHKYC